MKFLHFRPKCVRRAAALALTAVMAVTCLVSPALAQADDADAAPVSGAVALAALPRSGAAQAFQVTVSPAVARSGMGTNHSVIARLQKGKQYRLLATGKDATGRAWVQIELTGSKTGWAMRSLGKLVTPSATATTKVTTTSASTTTQKPATDKTTAAPVGSKVKITASYANVRSGPGTQYAKVGVVNKGEQYAYLASGKSTKGKVWYKIQLSKGKTAWVIGSLADLVSATTAKTTAKTTVKTTAKTTVTSAVSPDPTTTTTVAKADTKVKITASYANVRAGAGTGYARVTRAQKGQVFRFLASKKSAQGKTWYQIELSKGKTGWVLGSLCKLTGAATTTTAKKTTTTTKKTTTTAKKTSSKSGYRIVVYKGSQSTVVYGKDDKGQYTRIIKTFTCSTGKSSSPTRTGTYHIRAKYRWRLLVGNVYGQYNSSISRSYLFHSVPYYRQNASALENEEYDKLGSPASKGCIRMCVRDSKWIYDNCPIGTEVRIVNDSGPAGPGVPKRKTDRKYKGWDPSDQWVKGNPYFA